MSTRLSARATALSVVFGVEAVLLVKIKFEHYGSPLKGIASTKLVDVGFYTDHMLAYVMHWAR